jgi:hypothetical protein
MTAAQAMLEQGDVELCGQFPTRYTHRQSGVAFDALSEDPQAADVFGDSVGLRFGEEDMVAITARRSWFTTVPKVGEQLTRGARTFTIAAVRLPEDGHLVGFICPQPAP